MREKKSTLINVIREMVAEVLEIQLSTVSLDSRFGKDLKEDSLAVTEILLQLEEKYGIDIPEDTAQDIGTVRDLVEYMEKRFKEG
ncbi:MAG: acyl carrier protein [Syntrophomonadaceae bacterium]|nr:acyl carrier protein [Syntrophomonadaceae bacterium]